ncbi:MAG: PTS sugar transporter subunit IIA [Sarcina sp.]
MYKILLVTHGDLGRGMKNTLKMFNSDIEHVHFVSLDESGVDCFKENLLKKMEEIYDNESEILVLADLFGGTPFNVATVELIGKYNGMEIIAGVNLPILIEASLMKEMQLVEVIDNLILSGTSSMIKFENVKLPVNDDDE